MEKEDLRLECLKIALKGGQPLNETISIAKEFEKYVLGNEESFEDLVGEEKPNKKKSDKAPKPS